MRIFTAKRVVWTLGGSLLLMVGLVATSLSFAHFELNESGVHKRLLLPVSASRNVAITSLTGHGDNPRIPGFLDGPVVRRGAGLRYSATWFCEDHTETREGEASELKIDCAGKTHRFLLGQAPVVAAEVAQMPAKVVALSDIEGNLAYLDAALAKLDIVDAQGNWKFGSNRLVIVGDSVDRGRDVFAVLWRLYGLTQQAHQAGGAVHTLVGNHEQYMLLGRIKSLNLEHAHGALRMGGLKSAYESDTILGEWLRKQPVLVKIGPVLFTHGGISPAVAAQKLTIAQINGAMPRYWRGEAPGKPELDAAMGLNGLTQYRGYIGVPELATAMATDQDVSNVLQAFGASTIVVGHTVVDKVNALYGGRVYAIDVNENEAAAEVLVFENGVPRAVDIGVPRNLPDEKQRAAGMRRVKLSDGADWRALGSLAKQSYEVSRVPHPY